MLTPRRPVLDAILTYFERTLAIVEDALPPSLGLSATYTAPVLRNAEGKLQFQFARKLSRKSGEACVAPLEVINGCGHVCDVRKIAAQGPRLGS